MFDNIICPVSNEQVNSQVSRLTVFLQVIILIYFIYTLQPIPIYLVTFDCFIRALGKNNFSPLCILASLIIKVSGITPKMIGKAPKVFASRLGFVCGLAGSLLITFHMSTASLVIVFIWTILSVSNLEMKLKLGLLFLLILLTQIHISICQFKI